MQRSQHCWLGCWKDFNAVLVVLEGGVPSASRWLVGLVRRGTVGRATACGVLVKAAGDWLDLHLSSWVHPDLALLGNLPVYFGLLALQIGHWGHWHLHRAV